MVVVIDWLKGDQPIEKYLLGFFDTIPGSINAAKPCAYLAFEQSGNI